jgi:hypothetical protein
MAQQVPADTGDARATPTHRWFFTVSGTADTIDAALLARRQTGERVVDHTGQTPACSGGS